MAIPSDTLWEVQTTGSDNNGGGWSNAQKGATGVDMTQAAPVTFTATLSAVGTTTLTDSANGFLNTMLGNVINIAGQGSYCIQGFIGVGSVTVDRALGTFSTTTGVVGGPRVSVGSVGSVMTAGNTIWTKTGTYSITSATANIAGGCLSLAVQSGNVTALIQGYGSSRGDTGTATLQASGISTFTIVKTNAGNTARNLILDGASLTSSRGFDGTSGRGENIKAINCTNNGLANGDLVGCEASGCTGVGIVYNKAFRCTSHGNTTTGFTPAAGSTVASNCISFGNVTGFADLGVNAIFSNCTAYNNSGNGFTITAATAGSPTTLYNPVSYGNTGVGISTGTNPANFVYNAFLGSNSGGATTGSGQFFSTVSLSANPFTNAAGNDFSLNTTAGGGAAVRAAGLPGAFPGTSTTGFLDGGAVQHADPVITFPAASKVYAGTDRGDGTLGTLHASNIATAAGHGSNLSAGVLQLGVVVDDVTGTLTGGGGGSSAPVILGGVSFAG